MTAIEGRHRASALAACTVISILALIACAPRYVIPGHAIMAPRLEANAIVARDGTRLALSVWHAQTNPHPRAVILALHGFNDYSNAFRQAAEFFSEHDITTYAIDQRGFGRTPVRGRWPGGAALTDDLADAVGVLRARHPDLPLFVLGESMGAAVALAWAGETGAAGCAGLILAAPAVWGWHTLNPFYQATLWLTAHLIPSQRLTGRQLDRWPSDNIEMLRALASDALAIKATRVDTLYGLVGLMDQAYGARPPAGLPLIILYGLHDQIVPRAPVEDIATSLGEGAHFILYPDGYHMLLRDLAADVVWRDIARFIADPARFEPTIATAVGAPPRPETQPLP